VDRAGEHAGWTCREDPAMTFSIQPGDVLKIPEADYLYGIGDLILRVAEVYSMQHLLVPCHDRQPSLGQCSGNLVSHVGQVPMMRARYVWMRRSAP
jgi:hypothetical protein